jgi:hypothetical protein
MEIAGNFLIFFGSCCLQLLRSWPDVGQEFTHLRFARPMALYIASAKRETIDTVRAVRVIYSSVKTMGHPAYLEGLGL